MDDFLKMISTGYLGDRRPQRDSKGASRPAVMGDSPVGCRDSSRGASGRPGAAGGGVGRRIPPAQRRVVQKLLFKMKTNLWHYTTLDGLKGILSQNNIWGTDYRHLNDSSEINYSKHILYQEVFPKILDTIDFESIKNPRAEEFIENSGGIKEFAKQETKSTLDILYKALLESPDLPNIPFVASFCKANLDNKILQRNGLLSQWRGYGKDGGYSIIFNMDKLIEDFKEEQINYWHGISGHGHVVYNQDMLLRDESLKKALDLITSYAHHVYQGRIDNNNFNEPTEQHTDAIVKCMMLLKHEGFIEESEYRFYTFSYLKGAEKNEQFSRDKVLYKDKTFKEMCTRNCGGTLVPYIKLFESTKGLPIEKICVGPHRDKRLRVKSLKEYLIDLGLTRIKIDCSDIPYIG